MVNVVSYIDQTWTIMETIFQAYQTYFKAFLNWLLFLQINLFPVYSFGCLHTNTLRNERKLLMTLKSYLFLFKFWYITKLHFNTCISNKVIYVQETCTYATYYIPLSSIILRINYASLSWKTFALITEQKRKYKHQIWLKYIFTHHTIIGSLNTTLNNIHRTKRR